jgi:hypothetical protein|tara:strand:+ start:267 stop:494 length:228 start_codon:yes stop_codon:yes gene_type:complete
MEITLNMIHLFISVIVILASAFGLWVNINNEVTKLKSRVYHLDQADAELKVVLADIATRLQHIELLLAANQIKDK